MLIVYGRQDYEGGDHTNGWLNDEIVFISHSRTDAFGDLNLKKYLRDIDGKAEPSGKGNEKNVYRHHIPYRRIYLAIEDEILRGRFTRSKLLDWIQETHKTLSIKPDEPLKFSQKPEVSRVFYDIWVDWALNAICQYRENMFYGPGTGDGGGAKIDYPAGGDKQRINTQKERLKAGASKLDDVLKKLSAAEDEPFHRALYKQSRQDIDKDKKLQDLDLQLLAECAAHFKSDSFWRDDVDEDSDDSDDPDYEPSRKMLKLAEENL